MFVGGGGDAQPYLLHCSVFSLSQPLMLLFLSEITGSSFTKCCFKFACCSHRFSGLGWQIPFCKELSLAQLRTQGIPRVDLAWFPRNGAEAFFRVAEWKVLPLLRLGTEKLNFCHWF